MTGRKDDAKPGDWKALVAGQKNFLRRWIREVIQQEPEAEMEEALGAAMGERTETSLGSRSGYCRRILVTCMGKLQQLTPPDLQGRFRTKVFERCRRSEKALVGAMVAMYGQAVSTRKAKATTEELCGHDVSAATVCRMRQALEAELEQFVQRPLEETCLYRILDARCGGSMTGG